MYYCRNSWRDLEHTNPNRPRISYLHKKTHKGTYRGTIRYAGCALNEQNKEPKAHGHGTSMHHITRTPQPHKNIIPIFYINNCNTPFIQPSTPKPCLQITPAASTNIFTPLPKTSTSIVTIRRLYRSVVATNVPALPPAAP